MEDYERVGMIDALQWQREKPTEYVPPPRGKKWRIFRAIGMLPIQSNDKAVLSLLVDHANPTTGRLDPGQLRISRLLGLHIRTVKRSIKRLLKSGYLLRQLRGLSTSAYQVNWNKVLRRDTEYETAKRCQSCHPGGDRPVPSGVSELSPKNEKRKLKGKTKHEMVHSHECTSLKPSSKKEGRGLQVDANGEALSPLNRPAEHRGSNEIESSFWRERERIHTEALMHETDPERRAGLEAALSRAQKHLRKGTQ